MQRVFRRELIVIVTLLPRLHRRLKVSKILSLPIDPFSLTRSTKSIDLNNVLPKLAKRIHRDSNTTASTQNASSYGSNNSGGYSPPSQPSPPSMGPRNGSLGVQYTENPQRRRSSDFNSNGKSRSNTADSQSPPPPPPPYSPNPAPPMPPRGVSSTGINGSNRNSPLSNVFGDVNNNNNDSYVSLYFARALIRR